MAINYLFIFTSGIIALVEVGIEELSAIENHSWDDIIYVLPTQVNETNSIKHYFKIIIKTNFSQIQSLILIK